MVRCGVPCIRFKADMAEHITVPSTSVQFPAHQRLCLYPSCGFQLLWAVMQLNSDLFVFSDNQSELNSWSKIEADFRRHRRLAELLYEGADHLLFRSNGKMALYFYEDNNLTLKRLHAAGMQVHHFVGICDGCREGGNYECVHDLGYLRQLTQLAAPEMRYTTDHSALLQRQASWNAKRKFLPYVRLSDCIAQATPSDPKWTLSDAGVQIDAVFELSGLLIRPDPAPDSLEILRMSHDSVQLDVLRPFRNVAHREILAEYRVHVERPSCANGTNTLQTRHPAPNDTELPN